MDKKAQLPIMHFSKLHIEYFVSACNKVLLGGNLEASKTLLQAIIKDITVYEEKSDLRGANISVLANVANNEAVR